MNRRGGFERMLTFFPKPYPDELLYSIIARYHVWSGNCKMTDTMEQLFDNREERANLFIPKKLQSLAKKTSKFGLDNETLLYEYTIFPLVTCFLKKASFERMTDIVNNIDQIEKSSSIFIYKNSLYPRYIRYCPLCIRDDRYNYGEAYWHRKHQLYGMEMCDKHRCRLKESGIEASDRRNNINIRFIALELLNDITDTLEHEDVSKYRIEMQIAYDVDYIYKNHEFIRNILWEKHNLIRETTINILFKRGLATKKGLVKKRELFNEFQNIYSPTLIKQFLVGLDNNKRSWLIPFYREGN